MMGRVLLAALLCGLGAGLFMSAVQAWRVTPLIVAAEVYETAGGDHHATDKEPSGADAQATHEHDENAWAPEDGFERLAFTVLSNLIAGVGFSMVLTAVIIFAGMTVSLTQGVLLGAAGFAAASLAPSAGLAPELPGMPAGDLGARQVWWWGTVVATACGIGLIAYGKGLVLKVAGAAVLLVPHIIGAPQPVDHASAVPAYLAAQFAANSLATAAVFWIVLGALLGWSLARMRPDGAKA